MTPYAEFGKLVRRLKLACEALRDAADIVSVRNSEGGAHIRFYSIADELESIPNEKEK